MTSFAKKAIKIGTIFLLCGVIGSFLPAIYVFVVYGAWPGWTGLGSLAAVAATVLAVSGTWCCGHLYDMACRICG